MILTDYYYLISTDSTNRYAELKKYAEKIGLDMETMGNTNGILYFPVYLREPTQKVLKAGTYFVSKYLVKEFLKTGTIKNPPKINTNYGWYKHKRFADDMLREIADHYEWIIPKLGIHIKTNYFNYTHAYHNDQDGNTFNLKIDKYSPNGVSWFNEDDKITEVDIPEPVKKKILDFARPIPSMFKNKNKK